MNECDVLVIGAGPAGTVAASTLRNNGCNVHIIEKQKFPRFVIGESLLPRCMDNLQQAGLLDPVSKYGFQEKFGARFVKDGQICDFDFSEQFSKGWTWTWQVPRSDFDNVLAKAVATAGVKIDYESTVKNVTIRDDGSSVVKICDSHGADYEIKSRFIIDASGYGRVLPRLFNLDSPSDFPTRSALFCHVRDDRRSHSADENRITIHVLEEEVWLWVIPFSNGTTSLGIVGPQEVINPDGIQAEILFDQWVSNIPELKARLDGVEKMMKVKCINGYATSVKSLYGTGYVLTGNSTEFLDPIFSSGVTLATESAYRAAEILVRQLKGAPVNWAEEYEAYIRRGVDVFRTYVNMWYNGKLRQIFFSSKSNKYIKRQICSILAGYVWDETNPFVRRHQKALEVLSNLA